MPKEPQNPESDPMLGEVERLLRQLDPPDRSRSSGHPAQQRSGHGLRRGARPGSVASPPTFWLPSPTGVWVRVALGAMLTLAMTQWPYRTCGWPLAAYLVGVLALLVAGTWAGYASWRRRMGVAHIAAVAVVFAAAVFAAGQVLPRIGYAAAKLAWRCVP